MSLVDNATPKDAGKLDELVLAIHDMERLVQRTSAANARVIAAYAEATMSEGLSPLTGHQFVAALMRVGMHLSDALSGSAEGHRLLRSLADKLGYDPTAYGDGSTDPHEQVVRSRDKAKRAA